MTLPDSLAEKIELFRDRGRFFRYDDELFDTTNWVAVMYGQNWAPAGYDPVVDALDTERLAKTADYIRGAVAGHVARLPMHGDFIARTCAMPKQGRS